MAHPRIVNVDITVDLTPEEVEARLATKWSKDDAIQALDAKFANAKLAYKEQRARLQAERDAAEQAARTRQENRTVQGYEVIDAVAGVVLVKRVLDDRVVTSRALTPVEQEDAGGEPDDRQPDLPVDGIEIVAYDKDRKERVITQKQAERLRKAVAKGKTLKIPIEGAPVELIGIKGEHDEDIAHSQTEPAPPPVLPKAARYEACDTDGVVYVVSAEQADNIRMALAGGAQGVLVNVNGKTVKMAQLMRALPPTDGNTLPSPAPVAPSPAPAPAAAPEAEPAAAPEPVEEPAPAPTSPVLPPPPAAVPSSVQDERPAAPVVPSSDRDERSAMPVVPSSEQDNVPAEEYDEGDGDEGEPEGFAPADAEGETYAAEEGAFASVPWQGCCQLDEENGGTCMVCGALQAVPVENGPWARLIDSAAEAAGELPPEPSEPASPEIEQPPVASAPPPPPAEPIDAVAPVAAAPAPAPLVPPRERGQRFTGPALLSPIMGVVKGRLEPVHITEQIAIAHRVAVKSNKTVRVRTPNGEELELVGVMYAKSQELDEQRHRLNLGSDPMVDHSTLVVEDDDRDVGGEVIAAIGGADGIDKLPAGDNPLFPAPAAAAKRGSRRRREATPATGGH